MGRYKRDLMFLSGLLNSGAIPGEAGLDMFLGAQAARDERQTQRRATMQQLMGSSIEAAQAGSTLDQIRAELDVIAPSYGLRDRQINKLGTKLENKVFPYGSDKPSVFASMWDEQDDGLIAQKVQELFANDQRFMQDRSMLRQVIAEDLKGKLGTELYQDLADEMNASIDRAFSQLGGVGAEQASMYDQAQAAEAGMTVEEYQTEQARNPITDAISGGGALGYLAGGLKTLDDWVLFDGLQELSKGSEAISQGENGLGDIAEGVGRIGGAVALDVIGGPIIGKAVGGAGRFGANLAGRALGDDSARLAGKLFGLDDVAQTYLGETFGHKIGNAVTAARTVLPSQRGRLAAAARFAPMGNFLGDIARGRSAKLSTLGGLDDLYGGLGGAGFQGAGAAGEQVIDEVFMPGVQGLADDIFTGGASPGWVGPEHGAYAGAGAGQFDAPFMTDAALAPDPYEPNFVIPSMQRALPPGPHVPSYGATLDAAAQPPGSVVPPEWLPSPRSHAMVGGPVDPRYNYIPDGQLVDELINAGVDPGQAMAIADSVPPGTTLADLERLFPGGGSPLAEPAAPVAPEVVPEPDLTKAQTLYNVFYAEPGGPDWAAKMRAEGIEPEFLPEAREMGRQSFQNQVVGGIPQETFQRRLADGSIEHVRRETGEVIGITYADGTTIPVVNPAEYYRVDPSEIRVGQQGGGVAGEDNSFALNNLEYSGHSTLQDAGLYTSHNRTYDEMFGLEGVSPEDTGQWGWREVYDEAGELSGYEHVDFGAPTGKPIGFGARDVPEFPPGGPSLDRGPAAAAADPRVEQAYERWLQQMIGDPSNPVWREVYKAYNEAVRLGQIPADFGVGRFMRAWYRGF